MEEGKGREGDEEGDGVTTKNRHHNLVTEDRHPTTTTTKSTNNVVSINNIKAIVSKHHLIVKASRI